MITYNEANLFRKKVVIQKITSENQRFSGTSTLKKIEVFLKKVKLKTKFIVGGNIINDNLQ